MFSLILVFISLLVFNLFGNATESIIVSSIILITVLSKVKQLIKRSVIYYILSFIVSLISLIFRDNSLSSLINSGVVGFSSFLIVMFTGLLPKELSITRSLIKVRKDLSILGFIIISPYAMIRLFNDIDLVGIVVYVIMIPLFLASYSILTLSLRFLIKYDKINLEEYTAHMISGIVATVLGILLLIYLILKKNTLKKID